MKRKASAILSAVLTAGFVFSCGLIPAAGLTAAAADGQGTTYEGLNYRYDDNGVTITGYSGRDQRLTIPAEIEGMPVTALASSAFAYNGYVHDLTVAAPIEVIPEYCFYSCSLERIELPDTLKVVGEHAFAGTSYLCSVLLPDSVTELQHNAFYQSTALKKITIPKGITELSLYVFSNCTSLQEMTVPSEATELKGEFVDCASDLVIYGIPGSAAETYAEENDIPFAEIGSASPFIHSPARFDYILQNGNAKLYQYTGHAVSVTVPAEIDGHPVTALAKRLFSYSEVESVDILAPITELPANCFSHSPLKSVALPETLLSIGDNAFAFSKLEVIQLPAGLQTIGINAFHGCNFTKVIIPDGVKELPEETFSCCFELSEVQLPASLESIGIYAFGSTALKSFVIPENVAVDRMAFCACDKLESITLPQSMTSIPFGMCSGDRNLTEIVFPDTLTEIGEDAFRDCEALTSVTLPASVRTIGKKAFSECLVLTEIRLNDGLTSIDEDAFMHCSELQSVVIPASVTEIGQDAFFDCGDQFTVYGMRGSTAETYAAQNDLTFVALDAETTTSVTGTETATTETVPAGHIASDETLCEWAVKDYLAKSGIRANAALEAVSGQEYRITLSDDTGKVLEVYTLDPATGTGTNLAAHAVDLPQTGNNSLTDLLMMFAALALIACGAFAAKHASALRREK